MTPARVLVVGAGLIGTSVGLALRAAGVDVALVDTDRRNVGTACGLGAGRPRRADEPPADHAVIAVPPSAVAPVLARVQRERLASGASDVASVKAAPLAAAATLGCDLTAYVGGHPVAGSERSGPTAARGDLFVDRPWVLTPTELTGADVVEAARGVATACGARPVLMTPTQHDDAAALLSHAPQLVASVLGGLLADRPDEVVGLAGPGLRDVIRIAGSDAALWTDIATANASPLAAVLDRLGTALAELAAALRRGDAAPITAALRRGNVGYARLR